MPRGSKAVRPQPSDMGGTVAMSYMTDRQLSEFGLDPATAGAVLADAARVYEHINRNAGITRDELVQWAQGWGDLDRFNRALDYLHQAHKVCAVP
jgi:hypothetical protein